MAPATFHEILRRKLHDGGRSSPKMELTGILIPAAQYSGAHPYHLETKACDVDLLIPGSLVDLARRMAWGEVVVKGSYDAKKEVFEVSWIRSVAHEEEKAADLTWDLENFKRAIAQRGKLEPALDFLAS